jgi:hypothetical protein
VSARRPYWKLNKRINHLSYTLLLVPTGSSTVPTPVYISILLCSRLLRNVCRPLQATRRYIPEDSILHSHGRDNPKSQMQESFDKHSPIDSSRTSATCANLGVFLCENSVYPSFIYTAIHMYNEEYLLLGYDAV